MFSIIKSQSEEKIVSNFLDILKKYPYERHSQERPDHYKHVFNFSADPALPSESECYSAEFFRSEVAEQEPTVKDFVISHIERNIFEDTGKKFNTIDFRVMKLGAGCYIRAHRDSYIGEYAFVCYLHTDWRADWGGLLCLKTPEADTSTCLCPSNGDIVMFKNEGLGHFVTQVASYALNDRYSIAGFGDFES